MAASRFEQRRAINALARLHGLQTRYIDGLEQRRRAPEEAVVAVLRALGAPLDGPADAPGALRAALLGRWRTVCEPVAVVWCGQGGSITVRVPAGAETVAIDLALEDGGTRGWTVPVDGRTPPAGEVGTGEVGTGGQRSVAVALPADLPPGYHRAQVGVDGQTGEASVIAAPVLAFDGGDAFEWGVFLPVYALRSAGDWGAGSLSDLDRLLRFVSARGGSIAATLPILAAFLDEPFDPSPYAPASRLWWSEFYCDVEALPEARASERARALVASPGFQEQLRRLRETPLVDYRDGMRLRRAVLRLCAEHLEQTAGARRDALEDFAAAHPDLDRYASFRAATEAHGTWETWPQGGGEPPPGDPAARAFHRYAQFALHQQLEQLNRTARERDAGLYLDLPLGVHRAGYDVWAHQDLFATAVSGGAPPDAFFSKGQNWLFPPLRPREVRETGYAYPIACLRTLLRYATVLRIDHVIGLHRVYWIPDGFEATDGLFVRWPEPDEWYAILSLESHRARARVIGEDLGTVPAAVRTTMGRHGILRSYVVQESFRDRRGPPLLTAPVRSLASLNTHDMPTFAAWWNEQDVDERLAAGLLDEEGARAERNRRARRRDRLASFLRRRGLLNDRDVLGALLEHLSAGPARVVVASLEDLWGETEPQNRPGTGSEASNWQRRARVPLEGLAGTPEVTTRLDRVARRRGRRHR